MPITVCHPVWRLERGGLERQLLQLVSRIEPGIRHILIVRGAVDANLERSLPPQVSIIREPDRPDPNWSRRLAWILRNEHADVLHIRGLSMLLDAVMAAELCESVRVLFSFHGFESRTPKWFALRRRVLREAILRCDDRAAVGPSAAHALAHELELPPDLLAITPNGVDTQHFRPNSEANRQSLGLPPSRLIVLCVANIKPVKGHETLIHAIAQLPELHASATFLMIGVDYSSGALPIQARSLCPRADIRFTGPHQDVAAWYQCADLYIQPSLWEGDCNALLEAMASALPVIATDVGGNRDAIRHGHTGILVPPADPVALAAAIQTLASDPSRRICLGNAARQYVLAHRSLDMTLAAWTDRYKVLAARSPARADSARRVQMN